ncbi:MAG: hypothetical protein WC718_10975 [Phycisphaerales bacterium]
MTALERQLYQIVADFRMKRMSENKKWLVFFGVDVGCVGLNTGQCRVRLYGKDFRLISGTRFRRRWARLIESAQSEFLGAEPPRLLIIATAEGADGPTAFSSVERAFETLRGAIELQLSHGAFRHSSHVAASGAFPPADWMIAVRPGTKPLVVGLVNPDTTHMGRSRFVGTLTSKAVELGTRVFDFLREPPNPDLVDATIGTCLRLYAQAMDQVFPYAQFLGLWQLAEALCGVKPGQTRGDPLPLRLAWFQTRLENFSPFASGECISYLLRLRHDMVHKGTLFEIDQEDVNMLKYYCEIAICVWLKLRKKLPTKKHLEAFYDAIGRPPDDWDTCVEVATMLKEMRALDQAPPNSPKQGKPVAPEGTNEKD